MKKQSGLSMIEVLVSMVILAVGLLALAALQIMSLQNNSNAVFRTQAMIFAQDMADRMEANYAEASQSAATSTYHQLATNQITFPTAVNTTCRPTSGSGGNGCNTAQIASDDYFDWSQLAANDLIDGRVLVCRDNDESNDLDSDNSGTIDNNDDPCDQAETNVCNTGGNNFAPYTIRVCWSETGNRRDINGDGVIDGNDRQPNEIILANGRVLHEYTLSFQ